MEFRQNPNFEESIAQQFRDFCDLVIAYAVQDTTTLSAMSNSEHWQQGLTLAEWRNIRWMNKIPRLLKQPTFMAVGAAHLLGRQGILQLLQQAGYQVIPVKSDLTGPKTARFIHRYGHRYQLAE